MVEVVYEKRFLKDLANIPSEFRAEIEVFVFERLPAARTLALAHKFEKMKGYRNCVKARFGEYRIGAYQQGNHITLVRVLHRKEIYRFFP